MSKWDTEVLIIGGGAIGTAVARELSKYKVDVILIEKDVDFGQGRSKTADNMVSQAAVYEEWPLHSQVTRFAFGSYNVVERECEELDVPQEREPNVFIFENEAMRRRLDVIKEKADERIASGILPKGVAPLQFIDQETLRRLEPNVNKKFVGGLYANNRSIIDSVRLCIARAENAKENGINIMVDTGVEAISVGGSEFEVETTKGSIKCRYIVNAAGEGVTEVARMANADDFGDFLPRTGTHVVLDKKLQGIVNNRVLVDETNYIMHTVHGSIFYATGGAFPMVHKKGYHNTVKKTLDDCLAGVQYLVPDISARDIINAFTGTVPMMTTDEEQWECKVGISKWVPRFINANIGFPGINASPAAAKEIVEGYLVHEGLKLEKKPHWNPYRKAIPVFSKLPDKERRQLIAQDPRYGHLVCRCETVTEGEICEAIRRGATTLDGVKFRCRPGMGRCQAGFCGPRVTRILARELGIPETEVTKKSPGSNTLSFRNKELLLENE
ncbi:MAG: FAD-dependent oxidoreductase [Chloroflexi bacterium]|nr:FAD-dependent oxidoreductase [Chloroflexota bacterium]